VSEGERSRGEEAARGEGNTPYGILGSVAVLVWVVAAIVILAAMLVWWLA